MKMVEIKGIIHGKRIELERSPELPDRTEVWLVIRLLPAKLPTGEGLLRAFGGWSDDPEGVDRFIEEIRKQRDLPSTRDLG
jgi:hypothetical protein